VVGRVWDAVNDPILGFVMDRSPRTRYGRFKPFALVAIPSSAVLLILMFNLPAGWPDYMKLAALGVLYFAFDACFTLMPFLPMMQSLSPDARIRSKLMGFYRVPSLIFALLGSSVMAIAIALGTPSDPNIGLAVVVFMVPVTLLSLLGVALIKEGRGTVDEEQVKIADVVAMVRTNTPLWIAQLAAVFFGFVWNMLFAGAQYYAKYAFGVENFGTASLLLGVSIILATILGVFVVQPFVKRYTPGNVNMWCLGIAGVPLAVLYLLNLGGPITSMPLFFGLMFLTMLAIGAGFVPGQVMTLECMDYNKYKVGKTMQGSLNSVVGFIQKLQSAAAAAVTGAILVAIGYDAAAFEKAETIPAELFGGLGLAMFGIPVLCVVAAVAIQWFYPLRKKADRDRMYAEIAAAGVDLEHVTVADPTSHDGVLTDAAEVTAAEYNRPVSAEELK
jgi:Na+/melibiose symporter-like transporter